ncbi:hypothetical protein PV326_010715 [Microctonus aethiopoides]|nr:hypothetical protein PV326_010715 [Microctonus aethiopoides]
MGSNLDKNIFSNGTLRPLITISKNHAEIKARPKSAFVCDLRSSNKTRLNNEILRPLRFYQVVDEAEITFGIVNARYLFLRDIDNEIIVPDTPASSAKSRLNLVIANKKNLNSSTISESDVDDDSVIPSTQTNDDDDRLFAIPSPRNRRSSTKIVNCNVQIQKTTKKIISIHDVETQQLDDESSKDISHSETHYNNDADDLEDIYTMQTQKVIPAKNSQRSIHDIETQKLGDADNLEDIYTIQTQKTIPAKNFQRSIHDIETQKLGETEELEINMERNKVANPFVNLKRSIHELETQKLDETEETETIIKKRKVINSFMKLEQSIHEMETQKLDSNEEIQPNAAKAASCNAIILDDIFTAETQRNVEAKDESSSIKVQKTQCKNNEDVAAAKKSKEVNKKVESNKKNENSEALEATSETSQNKNSNLIIDETDDESETDEEGAFANVTIRVDHCDQSKKKNINRVLDSDSETDEDGEFAALGSDWNAGSVNSSKKIADDKNDNTVAKRQIETRSDPESPCLNERFSGQNSILNDEIINSDDDESADNINNSKKNHQADLLNKNGDGNCPLLPTTPKLSSAECKSNKSVRKSLNKTFISDDDDDDVCTAATQFIPIPESNESIEQSPKAKTDDDDDDDLESTQIIQSPKKQVAVEQIKKTNVKSDNIHDMKSLQISISNDEIEAKKFSKKNQKDDAPKNELTVLKNIPSIQSKNNVEIDDSSNNFSANLNNNHSLSSTSTKLSRNISNKITAKNYHCDDDDDVPTQVIDVQTAMTQAQIAFKEAQINKNHNANGKLSDKNKSNNNAESPSGKLCKIKNNEVEISKISLRSRRNLDTSIAAIEEVPNNPGDLNDSISENLENLFGKENKVDNIIQPITLATQQLQDILEHTENISYKKCNKLQAADKLNVLDSLDNDSEEYFSNLHSKRKHCMITESDDTTELEEDTSTSSTSKNIVYEAGTSGFEKGVAVISETTIGVCASPVKKQPKNSIKKDSVAELKSTNKTTLSDKEEEEDDDENDDILKGLPEVRIYGTASYPASPTTSVCSLDEWEKYERKRIESLEAKKVKRRLNTADSTVTNVSSDTKIQVPINEKKLPIQSREEKKSSVSSDDEDLNYEDLKKMAVDFISADTRTKELSIKLEKISDPQNYRSFSNDISKEYSINLDEKSQVLPDKRKRGRPKKVNDSESVLENNKDNSEDIIKSVDNISQIKRSRLQDTSVDSSSCSSTTGSESLEVNTDFEVRKRVRKIPEKFKDSNDLPSIHQTQSKSKKSKANIIESPSSSSNRVRPQHIVLLTGVNRTEYERKVKLCGGIISDMPDEATILVTDKIRRTNKLFCAITRHIPIVSVEWIEDSMKEKSFLDWNDYFLKDPAVEAKYKFCLKESLERAAKKKLLDGYTFVITNHVIQPSVEEIKSMIQMSGGKALVRPPKVWTPNTIIITCLDDVKKVKSLLSKVPIDLKIPVFSTEFILSGILKQELNFDANCIQV